VLSPGEPTATAATEGNCTSDDTDEAPIERPALRSVSAMLVSLLFELEVEVADELVYVVVLGFAGVQDVAERNSTVIGACLLTPHVHCVTLPL